MEKQPFKLVPHTGYLCFLKDEQSPDIETLKEVLTVIVPLYNDCVDEKLFALEAQHLIALEERIEYLIKKYPVRLWYFGSRYKRRKLLLEKLHEAKANCSVASFLLIFFKNKNIKGA